MNVRIKKEIEEGAEKRPQGEQNPQDNKKRPRQKQDRGKRQEGKGNQTQENLENQSPNPSSGGTAHVRGSGNSTDFPLHSQNVGAHGSGHGNGQHIPPTTSAATSSLRQ